MSIFDRTKFLQNLDATLGSWLCRIMGSLNHTIHGDTPATLAIPKQVRRLLIIRPGGMGDMILLLPVIRLLKEKYPQAMIDIVCEKRNVDVLKLAGMAASALIYDANPLGFLCRLRSRSYDVAIDTEQFHHFSAIFALLSKSPVRIGFKINPRRNPLYTHLVNYSPDGHEGDQFMRLIEPLGIVNTCYDVDEALPSLKPEMPQTMFDEIKQATGTAGFAVVHAGSSSKHKLWRTENYVKLAELLKNNRDLGMVLIGGAGDRNVSAEIAKDTLKADYKAISVAGKFNLEATAAAIKQSRVFIGTDSGLAHLAVALGTPTVVLFGPSDHQKWGTDSHTHAVVRSDLPCAPCFIFGYHKPCRNIACMAQIGVEAVAEAVGKVM